MSDYPTESREMVQLKGRARAVIRAWQPGDERLVRELRTVNRAIEIQRIREAT